MSERENSLSQRAADLENKIIRMAALVIRRINNTKTLGFDHGPKLKPGLAGSGTFAGQKNIVIPANASLEHDEK